MGSASAKILVTGGAGFIGSNLVRMLIATTNSHVINVDKLSYAANLASLSDVADHPRYSFEQVNLCDQRGLEEVFAKHRPDAVMHLAAESHVDRSIDNPDAFLDSNVKGTYNLLQASLTHWLNLDGVEKEAFRFLHVSTDEVYGSLGADSPPFTESSPYDPHSPYSATKAASDHLARAWHVTYGLPVVVTNCSNNYGPYQFPEKLIPTVILKCLRGESIPVYGVGQNVRDWLYVGDHCRALCLALVRGLPGRTYNIGGGREMRNIDLVTRLCDLVDEERAKVLEPLDSNGVDAGGRKPSRELITFVPDRPGHDFRYALDAGRIRDELGWEPLQDAEAGLRGTVRWYLQNREWWQPILDGASCLKRLGTGLQSEGRQ